MTDQPQIELIIPEDPRLSDLAITPATALRNTPVKVYLNSMGDSSRVTLYYALQAITRIVVPDQEVDVLAFPWETLRYDHIVTIRSKLIEMYSLRTANLYLAAIRGVLKTAWKMGVLTHENYQRAVDFEWAKGDSFAKGRALPDDELQKLFEACDKDFPGIAAIRDSALIATVYACGLRRMELVHLKVENLESIEMPEGVGYRVLILKGKGNKDRYTYMTPAARVRVDKWLKVRGNAEGFLFPRIDRLPRISSIVTQTVYDLLKRRSAKAGIKRVQPHDLRRTFVTNLLRAGVDEFTVQKLAGHASITTTQRYDMRDEGSLIEGVVVLNDGFK